MATNFSVTVNQIVLSALRKLGVIVQGDTTVDSSAMSEAILALNIMASRFFTLGMPVYREVFYQESALVAGQSTYTISAAGLEGGLFNTYQAFLRTTSTGLDIPLRVVSREEYWAMPNKSQQGVPVMVAVAPDAKSFYSYLVPDSVTASTKTIILRGYKQEEVYTANTDSVVFPREWHEALVYGLAVRLAPEYGVALENLSKLEQHAASALEDAINYNPTDTSTFFGVAVDGRS